MRYGPGSLSRFSAAFHGPAFAGMVLGLLTWTWCSQFIMTWGIGSEAAAALGIAILVALTTTLLSRRDHDCPAWVWLALAAWTVVAPSIFAFTAAPRASIVDDAPRAFFAALSSALLFLSPGIALVLRSIPRLRKAVLAIGAAWCLAPLTVGAWPGPATTALCVAAILLAKFARQLLMPPPRPSIVIEKLGAAPAGEPWVVAVIPALAAGVTTAILHWLQSQLFLSTAALWCAGWGGLLIGASVALHGSRCDTETSTARAARHCVLLALLVAGLAITFPWSLRLAMAISGSVSWLPAILGLRTLIVAAFMVLPGVVLGAALVGLNDQRRIAASARPLTIIAGFALALGAASWANLTLLSALPFAIAACVVGTGLWMISLRSSAMSNRLRWTAPAGAAFALAAASLANPSLHISGQRVLFSGPHFQARALGVPINLLHSVDDGRLRSSTVTSAGVTSVWNHSGVQWVLRENGLTRGVVSTQPDLCPQSVPEVLAAVLPLTMHTQPHHILITSASYPTVAATCLLFPVESVTAIEDNAAALKFCREAAERVCPSLLKGDNRLALRQADPVRGLATIEGQYDVVIAPDSVIGDVDSVRQWSIEHLQNVARHLTPEGVFCQRVACFDLNVASVLDLVRTAQAVFPMVQLNEVAPGEWLLIARPTADVALDKSFLERLEKPHVRDILAHAGWDWSIMLSLKTIHPADLASLAAGASVVSGRDAQVVYALPFDVMRWGPKFEMRRQWIAKHSRPLGDALGEEPALADVAQRLSDVTLAQQIMLDHPDQFAAYRHFVKKRLQDRPRPKVIQVAGEGLKNGLDPEDSRRKVYVTALGKAVETKSRRDIDRLIQFISPFDPLVTPFIPREYVHIDRQSESPDFAAQWRCGFRSVYFSPPSDASVNNVCDALELLRSHPEVAGDATAQWNCCNALLEVLKNRWGLRIMSEAKLRYGVADAHRTLELATASLDFMDSVHAATGLSEDEWRTRRVVLEKHLIRPVRAWRTEQSAKLALTGGSEAPASLPPAPESALADGTP